MFACSLNNPWIKQEIHVDLKTMYRVANAMYMPKNALKENIYIYNACLFKRPEKYNIFFACEYLYEFGSFLTMF